MSMSFSPYVYDNARNIWIALQNTGGEADGLELSLSNGNGCDILLALGLAPDPHGEPYPIDIFAGLVTAALRRHLGQRSPGLPARVDVEKGRATIVFLGRREGYIEDRLGDLARLVQRSRAAGATHIGWS